MCKTQNTSCLLKYYFINLFSDLSDFCCADISNNYFEFLFTSRIREFFVNFLFAILQLLHEIPFPRSVI